MKLVSWNVNGLRAIMNKDFMTQFEALDADVLCLQEIKMQEGQLDFFPEGYHTYYHYALSRKGYSGTAVFSKEAPLSVSYGIGLETFDQEGRVITCEYDDYYVVCCYTPNAQPGLKRLDFRLAWEAEFLKYLQSLEKTKPVILCGDLNVAHQPIDLKNPSANRKNPGFSDQERAAFTSLLNAGFIDTFRYFYPEVEERYSWWSYRFGARERNAGWRIDYFVVSDTLKDRLVDAAIYDDYMGSDHCPVVLFLK